MDIDTINAENIRQTRQKMGLNGQDFATKLGTTAQTVYRWEKGRAIPRAKKQRERLKKLIEKSLEVANA